MTPEQIAVAVVAHREREPATGMVKFTLTLLLEPDVAARLSARANTRSVAVTTPKKAKVRVWLAIQSGTCWGRVAVASVPGAASVRVWHLMSR